MSDRLSGADARLGGGAPDELRPIRPPRDVLIPVLGVADERHVIDVDAEQVEGRFRGLPSEHGHRTDVPGANVEVLDRRRASAQLHLATAAVP
jgi:hypothetical protein